MPDLGTHICSVSSSGIDSRQGAGTTAESAGIGADASAYTPTHLPVTSSDIQEEQALQECTFAPRLNPNKEAKSVVAQTWKSLPMSFCQRQQCTAAAANRSEADQGESLDGAGAEDDSPSAASAVDGEGNESPNVASATAVVYAGGDKGNVFSGNHRSAQSAEQQPARAVSTRSSLRRAHRSWQLSNSYAASTHRSKSSTAAAVHADALQQQQHAAMYDTLASIGECAKIEAQLQAEVAGCDKRLEQCRAARRKDHVVHKAVSSCPSGNSGAEHQDDSNHRSKAQLQQSALKVAVEAELADGSASRFEVQQVSSWPCRCRPPQPCVLSNFSAVVCQVLALIH